MQDNAPKFEIGDRVISVQNGHMTEDLVGLTGTVMACLTKSIQNYNIYSVKWDSDEEFTIFESAIQLLSPVNESDKEFSERFKYWKERL